MKNNAELIKKWKRKWLGHWLRRTCLLKDVLETCKRTTEETSGVFCVESSVVWCRDLDTTRNEQNNWKHLRCGYRYKRLNLYQFSKNNADIRTDKIKNAVVLERVGEGRIMLELIRKKKRDWLGTG